jgi:hypothetical protein
VEADRTRAEASTELEQARREAERIHAVADEVAVAILAHANREAEGLRAEGGEVLAEAERDAERLRAKAALSDAKGEADRRRAGRTVAEAQEAAESIRDGVHRIRPDASLVDTDDEITAYAREERWHPGGAPHA